jgi:carboxyl-terminal processing protease
MRRLIFSAFLALSLTAQAREASTAATPSKNEESPYDQLQLLARAIQLIRQDYVDETKIDYKELTYSALRGMLDHLDPHSQFMEPKSFKSMQEDTRSEFGGLGVVVTQKSGILTVINPMEDTPGFKAGILPGDQILKINGENTDNLALNDAVEKLRGNPGEKVSLTLRRPSTGEVKDYEIAREVIKVASIKDACILPRRDPAQARIGYARITQFNEPTASELGAALDKLEAQGMDALILDLRHNPGGLLGSAVDVCGHFVPPNTLVVSTEGRAASREYRTSVKAAPHRKYPVVVLTNYASASGSEIVAGALKDLDRALIVGETTFGKGSVQSIVSLPDGSAARLTTAKYFTPGRKLIHEHGVSPHIRATLTHEEESDLLRSRRKREDPATSETAIWDPQLERAVDALLGSLQYVKNQNAKK